MSRFSELTTNQVYTALDNMVSNRQLAQRFNDKGLVESLQYYIDQLAEVLVERNTDPCTTAADIRYFVNNP